MSPAEPRRRQGWLPAEETDQPYNAHYPILPKAPDMPASNSAGRPKIIAVIVTRNRAALLKDCLIAIFGQSLQLDETLVIDNCSTDDTAAVIADFPGVTHLRMSENLGGAGGFRYGIEAALKAFADYVWLMDDDGLADGADCLKSLLDAAQTNQVPFVAPLVVDVDDPARLAFPLRINGKTLFLVADVEAIPSIENMAHLFNGALIHSSVFWSIGLPEPLFFIRGDEVEFLYRARRHSIKIILSTRARFRHPSSRLEIFPIMFGLFYAVVPTDAQKRYFLARNRGYIFRRYRMWHFLIFDIIRYGWFFLLQRHDPRAFSAWMAATFEGFSGRFLNSPQRPMLKVQSR